MCAERAEMANQVSADVESNARAKLDELRVLVRVAMDGYQKAAWRAREKHELQEALEFTGHRNYWMGVRRGIAVASMTIGVGQLEGIEDLGKTAMMEMDRLRKNGWMGGE